MKIVTRLQGDPSPVGNEFIDAISNIGEAGADIFNATTGLVGTANDITSSFGVEIPFADSIENASDILSNPVNFAKSLAVDSLKSMAGNTFVTNTIINQVDDKILDKTADRLNQELGFSEELAKTPQAGYNYWINQDLEMSFPVEVRAQLKNDCIKMIPLLTFTSKKYATYIEMLPYYLYTMRSRTVYANVNIPEFKKYINEVILQYRAVAMSQAIQAKITMTPEAFKSWLTKKIVGAEQNCDSIRKFINLQEKGLVETAQRIAMQKASAEASSQASQSASDATNETIQNRTSAGKVIGVGAVALFLSSLL